MAAALPALRHRFRTGVPAEARAHFQEQLGHLTATQLEALFFLHQRGEGMTMNELAAAQATAPSTATELVDRLVRIGLVVRVREPEDRRVVRVALAPGAREQFEQLARRRTANLEVVTESLSDAELETFVGLLEKVAGVAEGPR